MTFQNGERVVYIGHNHTCQRGCCNVGYWERNYGRVGVVTAVEPDEICFDYTDDKYPRDCTCSPEHAVREEAFHDDQSRG